MPLSQSLVGIGNMGLISPDGNNPVQRAGRMSETVAAELHGKYYEQCSRGNVYIGSSASGGIAIILPAAGGGHPTLWNPAGSGVNVSLIRLAMSYVSGNNAPCALEWALTSNAGSQSATGAAIATATLVAATPALIGGSGRAKALWSPTTNTFAAAPTFLAPTGFALDTMISTSTNAPFQMIVDYDGMFVLSPGNAISLCNQTTTTTAVFQIGLTWEEVPI